MTKQFKYKAKKGLTESVEGSLLAETEEEVLTKINGMGLVPVLIQEEVSKASSAVVTKKSTIQGSNSHTVTVFYRQLARLLKSGVPLLPSLQIMSEQLSDKSLGQALHDIKDNVREGRPLSQSMSCYPRLFSGLDIAIIQAGESVGRLDETLTRIANYRRQRETLLLKIRNALAYPMFVVGVGIFAVGFTLVKVIPKFENLFQGLGQELPLPTRILITSSRFIQTAWPGIAAGLVLAYFLIRRYLKSSGTKASWQPFLLRLPKIGKLILISELFFLCRTLELLLRSGIPLLQAIRITLPVLSDGVIRKEIQECSLSIEQGGSFGEVLRKSKLMPLFVVHLIRIGEETGRLDETLADIADWYEQEIADDLEVMARLLEPILILIIGLLLGLIIIAVLLPVFSLNAMVS